MTATTPSADTEFVCQQHLDLFDDADCQTLGTQAARGRHLKLTETQTPTAILVEQCEDAYRAWLPRVKLSALSPVVSLYQAIRVERPEVSKRIPAAIRYCQQAQQQTNHYQWGGNIGPHYDCSGLMQAAFQSQGIWLPRDSYQQAAFCEAVIDVQSLSPTEKTKARHSLIQDCQPGDLLFFGSQRIDHVGLYLGAGQYLHSSGKSYGRNGIGVDSLTDLDDPISQNYFQKWWSIRRVTHSFDPQKDELVWTNVAVDTGLLK